MLAKHKCEQGFTLIEIMIGIIITGILSSISISIYREQAKKAHATEVKTQLSAASRKLIPSVAEFEHVSQNNCLEKANLVSSNKFEYSCQPRQDGSNIFDINVKPLKDVGVGGVLSFGIGHDKICWDTCEAFGYGTNAVLAKTHLGISDDCSALTRKERDYDCNCVNQNYQTCGWRRCNCICPRGWGCRCDRCYRCENRTRKVCETCTEISYTNEDGVAVDVR